jgi:hypothetical protein
VDLRRRRIARLADDWRAAARLAARRNGWQVRIGLSRGRVRAFAARVDPAFEERWNDSL